jgi:multidrug resistance efflux pump
MSKELFRKVALEKQFSPDQLEKLLIVVRPKEWIGLLCLLLLFIIVFLWSVFGSIPISAEGRGILFNTYENYNVQSPVAGIVKQIQVRTGDFVQTGAVLADLEDFLLSFKLQQAKENVNFIQQELKKNEAKLTDQEFEIKKSELQKADDDLKFLQAEQKLVTITAMEQGNVIQIMANAGDYVAPGACLLWIEKTLPSNHVQQVVSFLPLEQGRGVRVGMLSKVSLLSLDAQKYGQLLGIVKEVKPSGMNRHSLLQSLLPSSSPQMQIVIDLIPDANTFSGYAWTSSQNPKKEIKSGELCKIEVMIEERKPISYLLPLFGNENDKQR